MDGQTVKKKRKRYYSPRIMKQRRKQIFRDENNNGVVLCVYCTKKLTEDKFCLDHVVPASKGGSLHRSNLVTACHPCNTKKGNMAFEEFVKMLLEMKK